MWENWIYGKNWIRVIHRDLNPGDLHTYKSLYLPTELPWTYWPINTTSDHTCTCISRFHNNVELSDNDKPPDGAAPHITWLLWQCHAWWYICCYSIWVGCKCWNTKIVSTFLFKFVFPILHTIITVQNTSAKHLGTHKTIMFKLIKLCFRQYDMLFAFMAVRLIPLK